MSSPQGGRPGLWPTQPRSLCDWQPALPFFSGTRKRELCYGIFWYTRELKHKFQSVNPHSRKKQNIWIFLSNWKGLELLITVDRPVSFFFFSRLCLWVAPSFPFSKRIDRAISLSQWSHPTLEPCFLLLWSFSWYLRLPLCFPSRRDRVAQVFNAPLYSRWKATVANQNPARLHACCAEPQSPWKRNNL